MYLDTDIILALIKDEDWLKEHVDLKQMQPAKTSVFTVIEAELVLLREYSRNDAIAVLDKLKTLKIEILPVTEPIIKQSQKLLSQYSELNIFDSIHVACAVVNDELIVSTDTVFQNILGLKRKDPRE